MAAANEQKDRLQVGHGVRGPAILPLDFTKQQAYKQSKRKRESCCAFFSTFSVE
jgi:hypothetical protein